MPHVFGSFVCLSAAHLRISLGDGSRLLLNVSQVVPHDLSDILGLGLDLNVFAESEVGKLDVAVFAYDQVVRFQITVNVVHIMHTFNGQDRLGNVESRHVLTENVFLHK